MIKILIACSSTFTRLGLRETLSGYKNFLIAGETTGLKETILSCKTKKPDIILICAQMLIKSKTNIFAKISSISNVKIVIFNSDFSLEQELSLVKEGVVGILHFDRPSSDIVNAMKKIHKGELWLRRDLIKSLVDIQQGRKNVKNHFNGHPRGLTKKEIEILTQIADGCKNSEIATILYISESTVKTHINNIYRKLGVTDRFQAILYALKYIPLELADE